MIRIFNNLSSGLILVGSLLALLATILLSSYLFGYHWFWELFGIPTIQPHFTDLRVFTGAGNSMLQGHDPLYFNPGDPKGRELNHPRIWQHIITTFGILEHHTTVIGITLWGCFFIGVLIAFSKIRSSIALWLLPFLISPATLLALERANNDLLMFFLVCCFIRLLACSRAASVSFLLAGAALKFFPIFACLSFLRLERSDALRATTAVGLLFLVYLGLCWQDLPQIFSSTLKGVTIYSYGVRSHWLDIPLTNSLIPAIAITIAVVFVFFSQTGGSLLSKELATGNFLDSFRAGAGIYVGTFFLGNNWVYRLIFLILIIPQLVEWIKNRSYLALVMCTFSTALLSMWSISLENIPWSGALDEIANWVLFSTLVYLILLSSPIWVYSNFLPSLRKSNRG